MPYRYRIDASINRAQSALSQLNHYNHRAHPRSEPNNSVRNNARLTIDPAYYEIQQAVREGRWEGVSSRAARQALRAAELIRRATFDLSDRPDDGRPANVPLAQSHIRQAINLLYSARW